MDISRITVKAVKGSKCPKCGNEVFQGIKDNWCGTCERRIKKDKKA